MARTDTLANYLTDIADAIREKTGSSDPIQASSFDTAIENIPSGGGDIDWSEIGYSTTPKAISDGFDYAKDIYDNWNASRTDLYGRFSSNLNLVIMPNVDTSNATSMGYMFNSCTALIEVPQLNTGNVTNMSSMFSGCVSLREIPQFDTSKVTNMDYFLDNTKIETVPALDTSKVTNMSSMFSSMPAVKTIPELDASSVTSIQYIFLNNHAALTTFGGFKNLGKAYLTTQAAESNAYTLDLSSCTKLTHDSLMNVINDLYDIKTKGCNNQKLKLGSTNLAKLTAEEIAIATNKGWNVT